MCTRAVGLVEEGGLQEGEGAPRKEARVASSKSNRDKFPRSSLLILNDESNIVHIQPANYHKVKQILVYYYVSSYVYSISNYYYFA